MKGTIINFRRGRHHTYDNHMIISVENVSDKESAQALVGKSVKYHTGKKDILGKVASSHGNSGCVRVIFDTGMPGQAVGQAVTLN